MAAAPAAALSARRLLAAAVAAALVAGVAATFVGHGEGDGAGKGRDPASVTAALPDIERFVEKARGLEFKQKVKVALLGDAAFRKRLAADARDDADELADTEAVLQAVGLLGRDVDLREAVESLTGDAVAGFYDPKTKELVVRGERPTPYVRKVLAHELTHALDDQWFDLDRPEVDDAGSEAQAGFTGLVEGSAARVERAYLASLPPADRQRALAEEAALGAGVDPDLPQVLLVSVAFPYVAGPDFVDALYADGGQARLDAAFADPPVSTEQLLHPERYLVRDDPAPVDAPAPDGPAFDEEVVGELSLLLLLREDLDPATAAAAAQGWGGDRYVAWRDGERTCVRAAFVTDGPSDAEELAAALRAWAAARPGRSVDSADPITFTACA